MRKRSSLLAMFVAAAAVNSTAVGAQSIVSGSVSGLVRRGIGPAFAHALVTLQSLDLGPVRTTTTDAGGRFQLGFVEPGPYEIRVEAIGFRPVLARGVTVTAGGTQTLLLSLQVASEQVIGVDTVDATADAPTMWRPGGTHVEGARVAGLPDPLSDLAAAAALSSRTDATLGSEGLPGSMSEFVVDGIPFRRMTLPYLRGESLPSAIFARNAVGAVDVLGGPPDAEWGGSAGALVSATSRATDPRGASVLEGGWSSDALWSSSKLGFEKPALQSYWAAGASAIQLTADTSRIYVDGQVLQFETPAAPRLTPDIVATLPGLGGDMAAALAAPTVQRVSRASGSARLDWLLGPTRRFMLRAEAGRVKREYAPIGVAGLPGGEGPEEATDFSVAGGITSEYSRGLALELRAGVSGSRRTFGTGVEVPPTVLVDSGLPFGDTPGGSGDASRIDVFASPVIHYRLGGGEAKAGIQAMLSQYDLTYAAHRRPEYVLAGGADAGAGAVVASATEPNASFGTTAVGGFAQYSWEAAPGLRLTLGGRLDYDVLPKGDAPLDLAWFKATGLRSDEYPVTLMKLGGTASVVWDVLGNGRTLVDGTVSQAQGNVNPWLLQEVFTGGAGAGVSRYAGAALGWPGPSVPASAVRAPSLTMLGPDSRAPQTTRVGMGLTHNFAGGWTFHLDAAARRTDFLARRRDLNIAARPLGTDAHGREVYGQLDKFGALVIADPTTNRRFPEFDQVWAIDTDGWSKYRGVGIGLERHSETVDFFATYTRSDTRDNWVGAGSALRDAQIDPRIPGDALWAEGTSDFDVPDRLVAGTTLHLGPSGLVGLSVLYQYESGLPFTPGYRVGVDANGDGSWYNDVAWVPDAGQLSALLAEWPCLSSQVGSFAARNSCRGPARQSLDVRASVRLARAGGRSVDLVVDGYGLLETEDGFRDSALLLVDPGAGLGTSGAGAPSSLPTLVNPNFGKVMLPTGRGRILRVGLRIGGGS